MKNDRNNSNDPVDIESSSPTFSSMPRLSFVEGDTSIFCRQFCSTTTNATTRNYAEEIPTMLERTNKNIIQCMYDKYSVSQQKNRILIAESLFQAAISQASDPLWCGPGRISGRDFRSYQALLTMHVWFLHKRLVSCQDDPHKAALIQEELFDIFWIDSSNRMRAHGVQEMLINKNLTKVQQYTFMHMFHYDHCYTGDLLDNPIERLNELKNLVNIHILLLPTLPDDDDEGSVNDDEYNSILREHRFHNDQAERIAWYVETQYQNIIHDLPESLFQKARIAWVDLPSFDHMIDDNGKELAEQPISLENVLPSGWIRNIANDGTYYYWNVSTRQVHWDQKKILTE